MNPPPDIETTAKDAWHKLFLISDILRNTSYQAADQEFHFNFAQFPVIQFFFECPDAAPAMKDLIAVSGLSSGALSQAVDSLVLSGYVERVRSKTDLRSYLVHATAKLKALRAKSVGCFDDALRAFRLSAGLTPEEISAADEILLRLAESRTGGELTVLKDASGLETPGLISCGKRDLTGTPVWMLLLHFTTNLRMPVLMCHYGERKRTTLNKLRFMNYLFFLSAHKKPAPLIKGFALRFHCPTGIASQTLDSLRRDGMVRFVSRSGDRKSARVHLSKQGLLLREQTSASYTGFMRNFFSGTDAEKTAVFLRVLDMALEFLRTDGKRFLVPDEKPESFC